MSLSPRSRLVVLIGSMSALVLMITWAAGESWEKLREIRSHFSRTQLQNSRYDPERLRTLIVNTTVALFTFEVSDRAEDRAELEKRYRDLREWMDSTAALLARDDEREIFRELDDAFVRYLAQTRSLADANPVDEPKDLMIERLGEIQRAADQLLALSGKLADLRRETLLRSLRQSERSVAVLQPVIFGALLGLVLLALWSARVIYRETIAPLRLKLIETHAIAQRQEKLASLGVLAAGVAHEIRNPLTAIKARLYTQQKALTAGSSAHTDGEFIAREIVRLERIVRDFLSFARPAPSQRERICSEEIFARVHDLLAPPLQENGIELAIEKSANVVIEGDAEQLQQVLINLVQNAADSIGQRGRISLRARTDKIPLSENVRAVAVLEVEDNGRGIPAEVQKRLFDPFFSTKSSGTGLGLSIAARIVEQHGGALQYQTQVDRGTTFGIILPLINA